MTDHATSDRAAVTENEYWALVKVGRVRRDPKPHRQFAIEDLNWSYYVMARA